MRGVRADVRALVAAVPNIVPEAVGDVAVQLAEYIGLNEKYEPFVRDPKTGKARQSPENPLEDMTLKELVSEFLKSRTWYLKTSVPGGGGSGPGEGERGVGKWDPKRVAEPTYGAEWKKADPEGYAKAFEAHIAAKLAAQRGQNA
jgi:hypothetical protein